MIMTIRKVSEQSGVSYDNVRRAIKAGALEASPVGKTYAISEEAFQAWLPTARIVAPGYVTLKWAAAKSGIAETTIRKMAASDKIASQRVNGKVYVNAAEVEALSLTYDANEARRENGRKQAALREGVKREERRVITTSDDPPQGMAITERMMGALQMKARVCDIAGWY
jgi:excisionase family DNA binding protein